MYRQLQLVATSTLPTGTLIQSCPLVSSQMPTLDADLIDWRKNRVGKLLVDDGTPAADSYEFAMMWRNKSLIVQPDHRCTATYANDYCGPDRTSQNKRKFRTRLNAQFVAVSDHYGRPLWRTVHEMITGVRTLPPSDMKCCRRIRCPIIMPLLRCGCYKGAAVRFHW